MRTHVRNAMEKLGASTRSQAVALALESGVIGEARRGARGRARSARRRAAPAAPRAILTALLAGVVALPTSTPRLYSAEEGGC